MPDAPCCEQVREGTSNPGAERAKGNEATVLLSVHNALEGQLLEKRAESIGCYSFYPSAVLRQCLVRGAHQSSKNCIVKWTSSLIPEGLVRFASVLGALPHPSLWLLVFQKSLLGLLESRLTCSGSSCACQGLWQLLHLAWPQEHQGHLFAHESSLYATKLCRQQGR